MTDQAGAYIGLLDVAAVHADADSGTGDATIADLRSLLLHVNDWVTAMTRFDQLVQLFEQRETELLVVLNDDKSRKTLGLITEAFALRRYRQELEARQREIFGN